MSAISDFVQLVDLSATTRLRGTWLVSMLLGQGHAHRLLAAKLDRPGLEHMDAAFTQAAHLHEEVARLVPVVRRGTIVGSPNPNLLVGWALTGGLQRTRLEMDGLLATGLRNVAVSRTLIQLVRAQAKFGVNLDGAIDQAAALSSALDRASGQIREFDAASSPKQP